MPHNQKERLVIVHDTQDGDVIIPENIESIDTFLPYKISELRPIGRGSTQYISYPIGLPVRSHIKHDIILTKDSSYIGYAVPGMYTCRDDQPIYHISIFDVSTSTVPIRLQKVSISNTPLNTYDNVSIYEW